MIENQQTSGPRSHVKNSGLEKPRFTADEVIVEVDQKRELAFLSIVPDECSVKVRGESLARFVAIESESFVEPHGFRIPQGCDDPRHGSSPKTVCKFRIILHHTRVIPYILSHHRTF